MSQLKLLGMLNRQGMNALNQGNTDDAMFQLCQANRLARNMKSPLHEAKVRNNIALVHQATGRYDEAKACFRLAAEFAVEGAGEGNILHKAIMRNLTRLEQVEGRAA